MLLTALLSIGFSLFASALMMIGNLLQHSSEQSWPGKLAGFALIGCLAALQSLHLFFFVHPGGAVFSPLYIALLYCVAPSFYFYSRQLLTAETVFSHWHGLHALPLVAGQLLPIDWSLPIAFGLGSGYVLWLVRAVYSLRRQRRRFKLEILALAAFFLIAIGVIALGFVWPLLTATTFVAIYSILIGLAFFAALLTLLRFPSIEADVAEAAEANYAESTLKNVNRAVVLQHLNNLMREDKLYTLETLNLAMLAEQLELTPHQLSELINSEFQQGFSRYIREHRIEEAKRLLIEEPQSSVLSIGLAVGFSTQSNFYTAFRELVGIAPGRFRKQSLDD